MFLRRNKVRTSQGKHATYLSIVHNTWDGDKKQSVPFVLLPLGAEDSVDPTLADRLTKAMQRLLDGASRNEMEYSAERLKAASKEIKRWVNVEAGRKNIPAKRLAEIIDLAGATNSGSRPRKSTAAARSTSLRAAIASPPRTRQRLLDTVRDHRSATLQELVELRGVNPMLAKLTVGEIISGKLTSGVPSRAVQASKRPEARVDKSKSKTKSKTKTKTKSKLAATKPAVKRGVTRATATAKTPGRPNAAGMGKDTKVRLRTATERNVFDATVLRSLKATKAPTSISELESSVGGSQPQLRASLTRLVDIGKVGKSGSQRWTRYRVK
ncbi:MAG: hypothetical protein V3V08_15740 [Nannocystaceae bacterium]